VISDHCGSLKNLQSFILLSLHKRLRFTIQFPVLDDLDRSFVLALPLMIRFNVVV
jgi:hypothetical protein